QAVAQWIAELDSDTFAVREKANEELEKLGDAVAGELRQALRSPPSLEARRRLEALLDKVQGALVAGERLRSVRAVETLEQIGTPEARQLLESLAKGAPGARLTQEATESFQRLKSRAGTSP